MNPDQGKEGSSRDRQTSGDDDVSGASGPWLYSVLKRLVDLAVGCFILVLILPAIPAIAVMIKLDSPGPVFFRQQRVGRFGRPFTFYKFRSMHRGAESLRRDIEQLNEQRGPVFKMRSDPRVTSVGNFLRRSSLDEIPQILNVLKGDMSLVGPRPHMPDEVAAYEPWHRSRLRVKPGITCLWQVSGRSEITFDQWMRLDLEYIERRSTLTDLRILFRTVPAVMARRGAY
jgi:exopolysaccharide biosynthesis polyprenyl glycosylphosphotransferase